MDEHEPEKRPGRPDERVAPELPGWVIYAVVVVLVGAVVVLGLYLLGPQPAKIFKNMNNDLDSTPPTYVSSPWPAARVSSQLQRQQSEPGGRAIWGAPAPPPAPGNQPLF